MVLSNLIIEVTRRCNMECGHCLRGDAECVDIKQSVVDKLLDTNHIRYISCLTFTGGEPSLNVPAIRGILDACKERHIDIGNFYIATNGTSASDEFIRVLMDWYLYCSDNEITSVDISRSIWHDGYQDEEAIEKLKILKFVREKSKLDEQQLINEGRATYYGGRDIDYESKDNMEDELCINVLGDILADCNMSYEDQKIYKLGNVNDTLLAELIKEEAA